MAGNPSGAKEEWPHFYKLVFSPVSQGVLIPTTFMKKYGHSLNNKVILKVPATGASWSVHLRQDECGTWLGGSGWRAFAAYYGIEASSFLMFMYPGNGHFHVTIFDPNASEIEYPMEEEEEEEEALTNPGGGGEKVVEPRRNVRKEMLSSYRKAQEFRSENPFYMRVMYPSVVGRRYSFSFSPKFAGVEIPVKDPYLKFHVLGNPKVWLLKINIYEDGAKAVVCAGGWKEFVLDNDLRVNDVCIFELLEGNLDFNITIFRNT